MIKKYRKNPLTIEASKLTRESYSDIVKWIGDSVEAVSKWANESMLDFDHSIVIKTLEGSMCAYIGDYVIRGIAGEFYPCKSDIFEKSYSEISK